MTHNRVHTVEGFAALFQEYYTTLYNLPSPQSERERSAEQKAILEYLRKSGLPQISEDELSELDRPITADEVTLAMAQMQLGKAPGPDGYSLLYYRTFGDSETETNSVEEIERRKGEWGEEEGCKGMGE